MGKRAKKCKEARQTETIEAETEKDDLPIMLEARRNLNELIAKWIRRYQELGLTPDGSDEISRFFLDEVERELKEENESLGTIPPHVLDIARPHLAHFNFDANDEHLISELLPVLNDYATAFAVLLRVYNSIEERSKRKERGSKSEQEQSQSEAEAVAAARAEAEATAQAQAQEPSRSRSRARAARAEEEAAARARAEAEAQAEVEAKTQAEGEEAEARAEVEAKTQAEGEAAAPQAEAAPQAVQLQQEAQGVPVECTLKDWLEDNKPETRWSSIGERFYEISQQKIHCVDSLSGYDSRRPNSKTCQIIIGLLTAILEFDGENLPEVLQEDDILLVMGYQESIGPFQQERVHVKFRIKPRKETNIAWNHNKNYCKRQLLHLIFDKIVKKDNWNPTEWGHLKRMISSFKFTDRGIEKYSKEKRVTSHPCLWSLSHRLYFFQIVWLLYNSGARVLERGIMMDPLMMNAVNPSVSTLKVKIKDVLGKMNRSKWKRNIPKDTPIYRILEDSRYSDDAIGLLRFIRNLCCHYNELKEDGTQDLKYHRTSDGEGYSTFQFLDTVLTACFPLFLVDLYFKMTDADILI